MLGTVSGGLAFLLPGLICGGAMVLCMWMMGRGTSKTSNHMADREPMVKPFQEPSEDRSHHIAPLDPDVERLSAGHTRQR